MPQTEVQRLSLDRPPDYLGVPFKLVANGGPDEVGPVGVKTFLNEKIDMAQVDKAQVDRDLLAV